MPKQLLINIDSKLHARLKLIAKQHGESMTTFCIRAITEALDRSDGLATLDMPGMVAALYRKVVLAEDLNLPAAQAEAIDALTQMGIPDAQAHTRVKRIAAKYPQADTESLIAMAVRKEG